MTRPTCASVYSEKPAYTSIRRENSFFSSALSESQGRTMSDAFDTSAGSGLSGVSCGALRQDALLDHPRQHHLAIRLVAVVELALVLVDVVLRAMMRRVVGAGAEPHVPGPRRVGGVMVTEHAERLIGEILGEVIPLFRAVRLVDELVVVDQVRIPLVGLAAEEAVEAIEALLQRPLLARRARGDVLLRHVVILAEPERAPAVVLEDLRHRRALERDASVRAGEAVRALGDRRHAVQVMVAAGQQRGARRRAQRGRMPLRIAQAAVGQLLERRHVDAAAEGRPRGEAGVVVQHEQDVRVPRRALSPAGTAPSRPRNHGRRA